jgi:hypothetical protein
MDKPDWKPEIRLLAKILITFTLLVSSLIIIFGNYPDDYVKAAFGFVGIIVGYWLR